MILDSLKPRRRRSIEQATKAQDYDPVSNPALGRIQELAQKLLHKMNRADSVATRKSGKSVGLDDIVVELRLLRKEIAQGINVMRVKALLPPVPLSEDS
ncbi:MAG: hypothetical protein Q9182_001607 [Xanthomendoza sp. 2 TL-2023]